MQDLEKLILLPVHSFQRFPNYIPEGFETFPADNTGIFGQLVELNKNCVLVLQDLLAQCGLEAGDSAGLSIIVWAFILKLLSTPFYENAVKYPAQFTQAV